MGHGPGPYVVLRHWDSSSCHWSTLVLTTCPHVNPCGSRDQALLLWARKPCALTPASPVVSLGCQWSPWSSATKQYIIFCSHWTSKSFLSLPGLQETFPPGLVSWVCDLWSHTGPHAYRDLVLAFMLYCHHVEILNNLWTQDPTLSCCTRSCKLCSPSCLSSLLPWRHVYLPSSSPLQRHVHSVFKGTQFEMIKSPRGRSVCSKQYQLLFQKHRPTPRTKGAGCLLETQWRGIYRRRTG